MVRPERARGFAHARAALAGNPSDGYGGAVLAVTLPAWRAEAEVVPAPDARIEPENALVRATVRRFARDFGHAGAARWTTSIPQRVGLGSSSALVIAVLRALCDLHEVELEPAEMAELALAIEVEELGIAAGLQDRVVQAYGGLVFMDFGEDAGARRYERLDTDLLPPLVVAWREDAAASSATVHGGLRERHRREQEVRVAMAELADAARKARDALADRDPERFARSVDATFDVRERILELDPRCVEMIVAARGAGAAANYTGSGGAIVAACRDEAHAGEVTVALRRTGCAVAQYEYA